MSKTVKLDSGDDENRYRIIWKIENFDLIKVEGCDSLNSPVFIVNALYETHWYLSLYPGMKYIHCGLRRERFDEEPESIAVSYKISFFKVDGSTDSIEAENRTFENHLSYFKPLLIRLDDLNNFPLNATLTVCCEIYICVDKLTVQPMHVGESFVENIVLQKDNVNSSFVTFTPEMHSGVWKDLFRAKKKLYRYPNECLARTRFHKMKMTLTWRITEFSSYRKDQNDSLLTLPSSTSGQSFLINAHFKDDSSKDGQIQISIRLIPKCEDAININVICNLSMLDIHDKPKSLAEDRHHFKPSYKVAQKTQSEFPSSPDNKYEYREWNFANIKSSVPFENKFLYLQNDILSLRFDFIIFDGAKSSEIEESKYINCPCPNPVRVDYTGTNTLPDDLLCLCSENRFCDVSLQAEGEIFPAHKLVLCARSPVFSAMFEQDMSERSTGVVDIVDVEPETLRLMLMFMYSETLPELEMPSALKLYTAADKYQFHSLKENCSSFLVSNISLSNVCDILIFADLHHDKTMKMSINEYICTHASEIISSSDWKDFMASNMQLAGEAMHYVLTKTLNS